MKLNYIVTKMLAHIEISLTICPILNFQFSSEYANTYKSLVFVDLIYQGPCHTYAKNKAADQLCSNVTAQLISLLL